MKYYVLGIWADVQPMMSDAFDNESDRDELARQWKRDDEVDGGGIYKLDIDNSGGPRVDSYTGIELSPEEEEDDVTPENTEEDDKE
jgi:hypothetical protein